MSFLRIYLFLMQIYFLTCVKLSPKVTFNDKNQIPILGLGSYDGHGDVVIQAVKDAVIAGYRHIDTALFYGNEKEIGIAIKQLIDQKIVKREELFITTKVWNNYHKRERVTESVKQSLNNFNLTYVDLVLVHWPMGFKEGPDFEPKDSNGKIIYSDVDYIETWQGFEDVHKAGLAKSIGISNFNHIQIERLLKSAKVKPVINQVESHPYLTQTKLLEFCTAHDIVLEAYSPLGRGSVLNDTVIVEIASKHNKTAAQVVIRYQIQRGVVVIPKSVTKKRIIENFEVFDFELTADEIKAIEKLNQNERVVGYPDLKTHPYYPFSEPY